jgi:hypothetical protein
VKMSRLMSGSVGRGDGQCTLLTGCFVQGDCRSSPVRLLSDLRLLRQTRPRYAPRDEDAALLDVQSEKSDEEASSTPARSRMRGGRLD